MAVETTDSCELLGRFLTSARAAPLRPMERQQAAALLELVGIAEHIASEDDMMRPERLEERAESLHGVWRDTSWVFATFAAGVQAHGGFRSVDDDDDDVPVLRALVERLPPQVAETTVRFMAYMGHNEEDDDLAYGHAELIEFVAGELGVQGWQELVATETETRREEEPRLPWDD